jgi:hypothetical protein
MRSRGVPHFRQITAWQSPQTRGSGTGAAQAGQYNSALSMSYFAASILSTLRFLPASSSVPVIVTFLAANFSGVF